VKVASVAVLILLALAAGALLAGALLPASHTAKASIRLEQSREKIWQAITDPASQTGWRSNLQAVEVSADPSGRQLWTETDGHGRAIAFETLESEPPERLVRRISDPALPFGGKWTWQIVPVDGGSEVTITEDGEIRSPLFRFMARYVFGYDMTLKTYLGDLGRKFGEAAGPAGTTPMIPPG
jgi:uncharacterized protein YndB with AHSA1/START domain